MAVLIRKTQAARDSYSNLWLGAYDFAVYAEYDCTSAAIEEFLIYIDRSNLATYEIFSFIPNSTDPFIYTGSSVSYDLELKFFNTLGLDLEAFEEECG